MDKVTFTMEGEDGYLIRIEKECEMLEDIVIIFKNFLLANEFPERAISKYIDVCGEIDSKNIDTMGSKID